MFDRIFAGILYFCLFMWLAIYVESLLLAFGCVLLFFISYALTDIFKEKLKNKKRKRRTK